MLAKRFVFNENRVGIKIPKKNWRSDLKSPLEYYNHMTDDENTTCQW